jgi:hypothetical protein
VAASIQTKLQEVFANMEEERILDLFMDLPQDQPDSYMAKHFNKLNKILA